MPDASSPVARFVAGALAKVRGEASTWLTGWRCFNSHLPRSPGVYAPEVSPSPKASKSSEETPGQRGSRSTVPKGKGGGPSSWEPKHERHERHERRAKHRRLQSMGEETVAAKAADVLLRCLRSSDLGLKYRAALESRALQLLGLAARCRRLRRKPSGRRLLRPDPGPPPLPPFDGLQILPFQL